MTKTYKEIKESVMSRPYYDMLGEHYIISKDEAEALWEVLDREREEHMRDKTLVEVNE